MMGVVLMSVTIYQIIIYLCILSTLMYDGQKVKLFLDEAASVT